MPNRHSDAIARLTTSFGQRLLTGRAVREQHGHGESWHPAAAPDAVLYAESEADAVTAVRICAQAGMPIVPFGGGTSVEGQVQAVNGGLSIDLTRMDRIKAVRPDDMDCTVEPGITRVRLNEQLRGTGLFFPVDPAGQATLGGMAATRASGTNAVRYGTMKDMVLSLRAVLPDGSVMRTGQRARKSSAGYDLTRLMIGSEGTLGIVTELTLRLHGIPECIAAATCSFATLRSAVEAVVEILQAGIAVARIELADAVQVRAINLYSGTGFPELPLIFFELAGSRQSVEADVAALRAIALAHGGTGYTAAEGEDERNRLWQARYAAVYASKRLRPGSQGLSTDVCVPISRLVECIEETAADLAATGMIAPLVGHVGDGNFHLYVLFNATDANEVAIVNGLNDRLVERAIAMEGTCTGEHGIGLGKRQFIESELGPEAVAVMRAIKMAIDPQGIMNPGKLIP